MPLPKPAVPACVVLLHGIGMHGLTMRRIERRMQADGYRTINLSYPWRRLAFDRIALDYLPAQLAQQGAGSAPRLHFVAHSMGSLLVRRLLQARRPANLGRVVMLGPPNHGSAAADVSARNFFLRAFFGGNLDRLGTGPAAVAATLGWPDFEAGVIAGTAAINPLFTRVLGRPHDGVVSVESARLDGLGDFLALPYTHTGMLFRQEVAEQVSAFLRHGRFARPGVP